MIYFIISQIPLHDIDSELEQLMNAPIILKKVKITPQLVTSMLFFPQK